MKSLLSVFVLSSLLSFSASAVETSYVVRFMSKIKGACDIAKQDLEVKMDEKAKDLESKGYEIVSREENLECARGAGKHKNDYWAHGRLVVEKR